MTDKATDPTPERSDMPFASALLQAITAEQSQGRSLRSIAAEASMDHSYLSFLASGKRPLPPRRTLVVIAGALHRPPEYFLEYRQMMDLALTLAGSREPVERHWAAARIAILADQDRDATFE